MSSKEATVEKQKKIGCEVNKLRMMAKFEHDLNCTLGSLGKEHQRRNSRKPGYEVILSYHDSLLRKQDVDLLAKGQWLNDHIIAFWFDYLEHDMCKKYADSIGFICPQVAHFIKSSASQPSTVAEVQAMVDSCSLKEKKLILLPINDCLTFDEAGGSHWSLLTFDARSQSFEHYDSYSGSVNKSHAEQIVSVLHPLLTNEKEPDMQLDLTEMGCTQQNNSYDCGIHLICNAEAICRQRFFGDTRHICEIASLAAVKEARGRIYKLIMSLASRK